MKIFHIYGNDSVKIGDNCDIAPNVSFATGTHKGWRSKIGERVWVIVILFRIGSGCWIGINSTIFIKYDAWLWVYCCCCNCYNTFI